MEEASQVMYADPPLNPGKDGLTDAETRELQDLLDRTADACDAAAVILEEDCVPPEASDLQRIRDMAVRVDAMIDRIGTILGQREVGSGRLHPRSEMASYASS
jgi:hypothetical protein